jgi:hypothetical protein
METKSVIEARNSVATAWWTAVDADLLSRVKKTSLVLGVVVGIPLTTYFGLMAGAAWVAGIAWSLVNLGMMAGFTWPLFVAVMKAAGRAYLGLDETRASDRQGLES